MQKLENGNNDEHDVSNGKADVEEEGQVREITPPFYQSMCESCRTKGRIVCSILVIILAVLSFIGFSIANICIGVTYMAECPAQPRIPLFLIVFGAAALLILLCILVFFILTFCSDNKACCNICIGVLCFILFLFYIAWLIVGTYWTATVERTGDPESDSYCSYTLYAYVLADIVVSYVLVFIVISYTISCRDCWCKK